MTPLDKMLHERALANRAAVMRLRIARTWPPAAVVAVVVGVVLALLVNVVVGVAVGVVGGAAVAWWRWNTATVGVVPAVIDALHARVATAEEFPRFVNLIEGLTISSGIEAPTLYVVDDPAANAAACGAGPQAALVVTTGLLDGVTRVELEGVLAEQLARIRVSDAEVAGCCAVLVASSLLNAPATGEPPAAAATKLAKVAELLGERRHFLADLSASSLTRYPPGLRGAFVRMSGIGTSPRDVTWGTAHLWMCDPLAQSSIHTDHPPLQHRIDLLAEL